LSRVTSLLSEGVSKGLLRRYALMGLARTRLLSQRLVYEWALVDRPHYAYGLLQAAREASALGHSEMTAIEFGVAGGNGLVALEEYARDIGIQEGLTIHVVGFDTGVGLPAPHDYRDLPFLWASGDFDMDVDALRRRLTTAQLKLGAISETLPEFLGPLPAGRPIGFISIDVDLWSSTVDCLKVFEADASNLLPRVWCYFDDIVSTIPDIGELLAIHEFNQRHEQTKIRQPFNLQGNVPLQPEWANQMWQAHRFDHPDYTRLLAKHSDRELPLTD
jgi:hypothetical protein